MDGRYICVLIFTLSVAGMPYEVRNPPDESEIGPDETESIKMKGKLKAVERWIDAVL